MQTKQTKAIILARTNFAEADRILTILTKDFGKIKVIAKGVRKERSKLAGSIEPFCVSDISFIVGRSELGTLTSARLSVYYGDFINNLEKLDFAYACLKTINKITEHHTEESHFLLVEQLLQALHDVSIPLPIVKVWWHVRLSALSGHTINTKATIDSKKFSEDHSYVFVIESGGFLQKEVGLLGANHIKLIKIAGMYGPEVLIKIQGGQNLSTEILPSLNSFVEYQL